MYAKPAVVRYGGRELLDLMGPVETAYDCDIRIPDTVNCEQIFTVGVDISEVPDFKEALFTWTKGDGSTDEETIGRSECSVEDSWWVCNETSWGCAEPLGAWNISIMLINGGTATCEEDFTIEDQ
jgi:hypothetical protein